MRRINCPSNSRLFREGRFPNLFIEPGCGDGGLAVGVALYLYHNVFDQKLAVRPPGAAASPYMGLAISDGQIQAALEAAGAGRFFAVHDAADSAAQDLVEDRIIGWYEGAQRNWRPRLGHRLDPGRSDKRPKSRSRQYPERTRIVAAFCRGGFGIGGGEVVWRRARSCALHVIHRDGPHARRASHHATRRNRGIQTIGQANGEIGRVIEQFFAMTEIPILLNASFNGPSEPLVETPAEAIRFLVASTLDALYMGGFRVTRKAIP